MSFDNHTHAFACLGNSENSSINASGEWEGNNDSATGSQQSSEYYNEQGEWILLLNVEKVREALVGQLYNNPNSQQNNGDFDNPGSVSIQWKYFIETIFYKTIWQGVQNSSMFRTVNLDKVKSELTYVPNINNTGTPDPILDYIVVNYNGYSHRCIMGLYQDTAVTTQKCDHEAIGQLINNTNIQEMLTKLRNFGAFGGNLDVPEINPLIGISESGGTTQTYRLFKRGDTLAFPINIKSIVGHTSTTANESLNNGYSFADDNSNATYDIELQITFKQSVDTDSTILPVDMLDEWEYHDTLRWHEPSRTFQTIRYDQNENTVIYTPTYNENGERIDVQTNA